MRFSMISWVIATALLVSAAGVCGYAGQTGMDPPALPLEVVKIMLPASKEDAAFMPTPFTCTREVAAYLATYKELYLEGMVNLTPEVARELTKQRPGGSMCLDGLTTLTDESAAELANYRGKFLSLAVTTLSTPAAKSLASCKAQLRLRGIKTLPKEAADVLKASKGIVLPSEFEIMP